MKFLHTYVLCILAVVTQIKGAEKQLPLTEKQVLLQKFNELTTIPKKVRHTKTERQSISSNVCIIFGPTHCDCAPLYERPLNIYPMRPIQGKKEKPHLAAFKTDLHESTKKKIEHFSKERTFFEKPKNASHKNEPKATDSFTFNPKTKQGYGTQVLTQLKQEINPDAINTYKKELRWEIQKGIAALAIRYKQIGTSIEQAEKSQQTLNQKHLIMHDDFVFIVNALIDDIKANRQDSITDQQAIHLLFEQEASFTSAQARFNLTNCDTDEYMPDFKQFNDCYGRLPIAIARSARRAYNGWWTSLGEPTLAADLRIANSKLSITQNAKEKEDLQIYIANLRARLYNTMIKHMRTFSDEHLIDINYDLAEVQAEEQKIAGQLQPVIQKDIPIVEAIEQVMAWPKNKSEDAKLMATRLAQHLT